MSLQYSTTESWENVLNNSMQQNHDETVLHIIQGVWQEESYSCGTAVLAAVINAKGLETDDKTLIERARVMLAEKGLDLEETGTPPSIMKEILSRHNVPFVEKVSDPTFDESQHPHAQAWLEEALRAGYICITPIQTTPEYWVKNRHTGEITRESEARGKVKDSITFALQPNYRIVHTIGNTWSDRTQAPEMVVPKNREQPGFMAATTRDDVDYNGHYVIVIGMVKDGDRDFYATVDPMYKWWSDDIKSIDPEYSGIRFIQKELFLRRWHDRSGEGESFNQYAIAVPLAQP